MPVFKDKDEAITYLALHRIYVRISKNRKIFFSKKISDLNRQEGKAFLDLFRIESKEDCVQMNDQIRKKMNILYPYVSIIHWDSGERPRERLLEHGPETLSNAQLLAIILRSGSERQSAEELAKKIMSEFGSFRGLQQSSPDQLNAIHGLGPAKIAQIKAAMEIGKRMSEETIQKRNRLINPEKVKEHIQNTLQLSLRDEKKEVFVILFLDTKLKPINHSISTVGSNKESIVDIADIIRKSTQANASAIILVHNHPSGETDPSPEDIDSTRRVIQACQLVGILVLDHIIIGSNPEDMFSFASHKII